MMRCPDCNKFVSYGEGEIEVDDLEVEDTGAGGTVTGQATVKLVCAECSTELKAAYLDFEESFEHECSGGTTTCDVCDASGEVDCTECEGTGKIEVEGYERECTECGGSGFVSCQECDGQGTLETTADDFGGETYEVDESDVESEFTERTQREFMDRRTHKMVQARSSRYWRTFYGATLTIPVTCNICEEKIEVTTSVEEMASGFEELV